MFLIITRLFVLNILYSRSNSAGNHDENVELLRNKLRATDIIVIKWSEH